MLQSEPETDCIDPYAIGQCITGTRATAVQTFVRGRCYMGGYASFQLRVSSVGDSLTTGRQVVAGEWIPNLGSNARGPVSFYSDQPPFTFTAIDCPAGGGR